MEASGVQPVEHVDVNPDEGSTPEPNVSGQVAPSAPDPEAHEGKSGGLGKPEGG